MKTEVFNAYNRYMILKHGIKGKNISQTCELFGISRATYYNWNRAYEKHGMQGLEVKPPKKPKMPNKVSKEIEEEILMHVLRYPEDGPKRIFYDLRAEGFEIGESGVYNVLKRNELTRKNQRIKFSKTKKIKVSNMVNDKRKIPQLDVTKESFPGYVVIQKIDLIGSLEGIGKVYQYTIYDTYSKWGFAKIYNKKQDIDVWNYFELKLGYLMKTFNLSIENLLTEKNHKFMPCFVKGDKHKEVLDKFSINHRFIDFDKNSVLQSINEFNTILVKEFYREIQENKSIDSFNKLDHALQKFIRDYNFNRKIVEGPNKGKLPASLVLDRAIKNKVDLEALPLWLAALLTSVNEGEYFDK